MSAGPGRLGHAAPIRVVRGQLTTERLAELGVVRRMRADVFELRLALARHLPEEELVSVGIAEPGDAPHKRLVGYAALEIDPARRKLSESRVDVDDDEDVERAASLRAVASGGVDREPDVARVEVRGVLGLLEERQSDGVPVEGNGARDVGRVEAKPRRAAHPCAATMTDGRTRRFGLSPWTVRFSI